MAAAEMKMLTLLALRSDRPRLMACMQRLGCVQIIEREGAPPAESLERERARLDELTQRIERLDNAIDHLRPQPSHGRGAGTVRREASADQVASVLASRGEIMAVVERTEAIERTRAELSAQDELLGAQIGAISPWEGLTVPLDKLGPTRTSVLLLATVPVRQYQIFQDGAERIGAVQWEEVSTAGDCVNLLIAAHGAVMDPLDRLMADCQAGRASLPGLSGMAALALEQLRAKQARIGEVRAQLQAEMAGLADHLPVLRVLRDVQALERDQLRAALHTENTRCAFLLTGWVPSDCTERLEAELKRCAPLCELAFSDPGEGESPPILPRSRAANGPIESIVNRFVPPDAGGLPPAFLMAPFWVCFIGMMLADAGYGVLMGIFAAFWFHRLGGRFSSGYAAFLLTWGGLATAFWCADRIFGLRPILFAPQAEPLKMAAMILVLCVAHLFAGRAIARAPRRMAGFAAGMLNEARMCCVGLIAGAICTALNALASRMWGSPAGNVGAIAMLLAGHSITMGIGSICAYVLSCRMRRMAFFGPIDDREAREFAPLRPDTRYVDIESSSI